MNRILLSVAMLSSLALGCGRAATATQANTPSKASSAADVAKNDDSADDESIEDASESARKAGDFVVYRFSGDYRSNPLTLTERVVSRDDSTILLDLTLADGNSKQQLRVRMSDAPENKGEVLAVSRMDGDIEKPLPVEDYDALMAKTMVVADQNEGLLGTEEATLKIGENSLPCTKTSYRVKIGDENAVLLTVMSENFPWGDLAGEIRTKDGQLLYRAEIIEVGHGDSKDVPTPTVAHSDVEEE